MHGGAQHPAQHVHAPKFGSRIQALCQVLVTAATAAAAAAAASRRSSRLPRALGCTAGFCDKLVDAQQGQLGKCASRGWQPEARTSACASQPTCCVPAQACIVNGNQYNTRCREEHTQRMDLLAECEVLHNQRSEPLLACGPSGSEPQPTLRLDPSTGLYPLRSGPSPSSCCMRLQRAQAYPTC